MKALLVSSVLLMSLFAHAEGPLCKKDDLNDCGRVLKAKQDAADFNATFDQVCKENKGLKCVKMTVRGDISEEIKYQRTQHTKGHLFATKESGEDKIFILEKK